jgi:hypothetical protein
LKSELEKIVVEVRGGNVVCVYSDRPLMIRVLDWDNIESDSADAPMAPDFGQPEPLLAWMMEKAL